MRHAPLRYRFDTNPVRRVLVLMPHLRSFLEQTPPLRRFLLMVLPSVAYQRTS